MDIRQNYFTTVLFFCLFNYIFIIFTYILKFKIMTLEINEALLTDYVNQKLKENGDFSDLSAGFIEQEIDVNLQRLHSDSEEFLAELIAENITLSATCQ